jgi:hypothetical protein
MTARRPLPPPPRVTLDSPIEHLPVTTARTRKILAQLRTRKLKPVTTIRELTQLSAGGVLREPGCGLHTLADIVNTLARYGWSLAAIEWQLSRLRRFLQSHKDDAA